MQPVQGPPVVGPQRRRLVGLAVAIAVLGAAIAVAVLTLPGSSRDDERARPHGVALIQGKKLQSASCEDWLAGSARDREDIVAALEYDTGGPTPYGPASTLPAPEAHRLFDRACAKPYARGFLLYQLYTRAAAFRRTPERFQ